MSKLHNKRLIAILIVCFVLLGSLLIFHANAQDVVVIEKESYFNDFKVDGDSVLIHCVITLKNKSSQFKNIKIQANLPEDVETGLLKSQTVYAVNNTGGKVFGIPSKTTFSHLDVTLKGEYGGAPAKANKLLPKLIITEVTEAETEL